MIRLDFMSIPRIVRTNFLNKQISTLNISPSTHKKRATLQGGQKITFLQTLRKICYAIFLYDKKST